MRLFPSIPAATFCGAVLMPVFAGVAAYLEKITNHNPWVLMPWGFIGFVMPVTVSTFDLRECTGTGLLSFFRPRISGEAIRELYLPAWGRIFVLLISAITSICLLSLFGIKLS